MPISLPPNRPPTNEPIGETPVDNLFVELWSELNQLGILIPTGVYTQVARKHRAFLLAAYQRGQEASTTATTGEKRDTEEMPPLSNDD